MIGSSGTKYSFWGTFPLLKAVIHQDQDFPVHSYFNVHLIHSEFRLLSYIKYYINAYRYALIPKPNFFANVFDNETILLLTSLKLLNTGAPSGALSFTL